MKNGKIIFLKVPESLSEEIKTLSETSNIAGQRFAAEKFTVDPSIPLPVELETDEGSETVNMESILEKLSWEMIVSGMIQVISAGEVMPHWLDYYRHFILILKPDIYNEFLGAAIIKSRNADFNSALEIIAALESIFPFSPEVLLNKALIQEEEAAELERKGSEMEAALANDKTMETYTKALAMEPILPELLYNMGFFCMRKKDFAKAKEYLLEYLSLDSETDSKEKAESIIKEIESQGLDDFKYTESLDLIRRGKEEEALLMIRDFLEEHPTVWNAWFVLGWALRKMGRWNDALASFKKAQELGGTTPDTCNEAAICMMELGDFSSARKELEAALRVEPENIKIISNLGILAMKKGEDEEAAGFFRTVLELNPQDPIALKFFSR